jgi:O-methyltransferase involved in polyketide biosynthesis
MSLSDVSETALFTLFCHALDAKSKRPILNDQTAVETIRLITESFTEQDNKMHQQLLNGRLDNRVVVHVVLRAQYYDEQVIEFVQKHPNAVIINIACGMDNRFERVDNGQLLFYDLDLPEMIAIKKERFPEQARYKQIGQSVFEPSWMEQIPKDRKVLLLAEGLFMYCQKEEILQLLLNLQEQFPGCEFVFELFNHFWLRSWRKPILNTILHRKLKFGKNASMTFGLQHGKDIEKWAPGFDFLKEWSYFDTNHKKIGIYRVLGKLPLLRKTLWTVHYKLHSTEK